MRLVTFRTARGQRAGALVRGDSCIVDLETAYEELLGPAPSYLGSILDLASAGDDAFDCANELVNGHLRLSGSSLLDASQVDLLSPIPRPPQMRDFLCFEKHLQQAFAQARRLRASTFADPDLAMEQLEREGAFRIPDVWYERPIYYRPSSLTVVGPEAAVEWPAFSKKLDFELEFGCFIGKPGKDVAVADAGQHIFGYTIFNDLSARDEQVRDMSGQLGPGKGKDFDGSNILGPCLVTSDEIGDPYNLDMVVRVNGEEWGRGNSAEMHWKFEDLICHVSRSETLHSGEFLGSGTVGNGCGLEHDRFLAPGDVVELEVERIGVLRNRIGERGIPCGLAGQG